MNNSEKPSVDKILKILDKSYYKVDRHELLSNVFECGAIAVSNRFDTRRAKIREEKYSQIMKKYDTDGQNLIADVFTKIFKLLSSQLSIGFNDYLGELYMKSETSNSKSGQFFTPYCVSKICAECSINPVTVSVFKDQDKILKLHEPTCGSGGMIIATADILYNKYQFNISHNLLVECGDIDARCVYMTYLQLSLAGIPAIIYHRDGLTLETWDRWETPAYIFQWPRFRSILRGETDD